MNYYEVTFSCHPNNETNRDVLVAMLGEAGFESFTENDSEQVVGYIAENLFKREDIKNVIENFPFEAEISFADQLIISQNWNEEWEKNFFRPIIIDKECAIHSTFHTGIPPVKYDIIIDPKMAFGTGHHETTSMMIAWLLDMELQGRSLLDMGCGTAVLAILASMKGANPILAIDNDEWAYNNSVENTQLNKTNNIRVQLGDANLLGNEQFDLIFANINRNILLNDIRHYAACLPPKGELYMSGFYLEDIPAIEEECKRHGLMYVAHKSKNNWASVQFVKN